MQIVILEAGQVGARIGAIVRGNRVIIGHADIRIESEERPISFMTIKRSLKQVEKPLQIGFGYF